MTIREMRESLGDTQRDFSIRYDIPIRTIQNWESGINYPAKYVVRLLEDKVNCDLVNRRTFRIPSPIYDKQKSDLPRRENYYGGFSWIQALNDVLGPDCVFALDQALMCEQLFLGRNKEYLVWVYGNDSLKNYNGVMLLGNSLSSYDIEEKNGVKYTRFNRTLSDAIANEAILDMQGITEALSRYYYTHNDSFEGISVDPKYQSFFEELAQEAIDYYAY